jgi:hypothetical protein
MCAGRGHFEIQSERKGRQSGVVEMFDEISDKLYVRGE